MSLASGEEKPHLWLWGSVLVKNEIIRDEVVKRVRQVMPEIDVAVPETSALDLALMLAGNEKKAAGKFDNIWSDGGNYEQQQNIQ